MKRFLPFILLYIILLIGCSKGESSVSKEPPPVEQPETTAEKLLDADWEINQVGEEALWKYNHFKDLFFSNQSVTVFEINPGNKKVLIQIPYVESGFLKTSDAAVATRSLLAINGSYFDTKNGGSTVFFKNDGEIIVNTRQGFPAFRENAGFGITSEGKVSIVRKPESGWESVDSSTFLVSGPLLLTNGELLNQENNKFNNNRHPRTAVGVTEDNRLLAVVVDGRSSEALGMTIDELAEVMQILGCKDAMNMDGGGSSTAWVKNRGVVSFPSDNKIFDHKGERGVATVISFLEK